MKDEGDRRGLWAGVRRIVRGSNDDGAKMSGNEKDHGPEQGRAGIRSKD